jgi:hypothetical protein
MRMKKRKEEDEKGEKRTRKIGGKKKWRDVYITLNTQNNQQCAATLRIDVYRLSVIDHYSSSLVPYGFAASVTLVQLLFL